MNEREKYIANLATYLKPLTDDERNDALEFYDEYIVDAGFGSKAAIEEKLGTPRQLSYKILAEYSIKSNEESKNDGRPGSTHSSWRVFWWVLIAIIASPITFGLGIMMIIILIAALSLVVGLTIGAVGLVFGLIVAAGVTLYSGLGVIASAPFTSLFYIGASLSMLGLFLVCLPPLYWFIRLLVQGVANLAKYLYSKIQARRDNK